MNVTIYTPLDPTLIGGMRTWLDSFWRPIARSGSIALRVVHSGTRPSSESAAYSPLTGVPWTVREIPGRAMPGTNAKLPAVAELAQAFEGSDVVYVDNGYVFQDWTALRAARSVRARVVSGHHSVILHDNASAEGMLHNAAWLLSGRRCIPRFDAVHALNETDAAYLRSCGARAAAVIPLPVDRTVFAPGAKNAAFTVLFAGRLHRQKGVDRLVRLVEGYAARDPSVRFRIAGAGAEESRLRGFAQRETVTLLSALPRERMAEEMRSAHVLAAPSRTETFGFAAAESLSSGTPVVCSDTHGFRDLIDGTNGTIVRRPDAADAWIAAIEALRRDPQQYRSMCERARTSTARLAIEPLARDMLAFLGAR
ncbi:MAG TPA: glycosyltransferase [Candidatus Baltobacteraceae bacterium]|nr:glycosyltransferase [Candidatus Baltobacteraceae bacterium]